MKSENLPLPRGAVIGILGGGQLARLLAISAANLGFGTHIYAPGADEPAFSVSSGGTCAAYDDHDALTAFAKRADVVTYEFENVPTGALDIIAAFCPVRPGRTALATSQDRWKEKQALSRLGCPLAPYARVDDRAALQAAIEALGVPAILKTRRDGYDGKAQWRLDRSDAGTLDGAYEQLDNRPAVLEAVVDFVCEVSIIGVRAIDGTYRGYDIVHNVHKNHILHTSSVPAPVVPPLRRAIHNAGKRIADALDYVGVLAVEMFITRSDEPHSQGFVVNEIAPRVHNSGHWTLEACAVSQFDNHIRAITGLALGDTARHSDARMENLLGDDIVGKREDFLSLGASWYDYAKKDIRQGRKMGHGTILSPRSEE